MKRIVASVVLAIALIAVIAAPAFAGGAAVSVALGLASFAVFNQLVFGLFTPTVWASTTYYPPYPVYYAPAVYAAPPVVYTAPPVVYTAPPVVYTAPPAPAPSTAMVPTEVVYAHGRYVLRGDGITTPYQWVWIANAPPAPPAPPTR